MRFTLREKLKFAKLHVDDGVPLFEISDKDFSNRYLKIVLYYFLI